MRTRRVAAVVAATLALFAAACGSDGSTDESGAAGDGSAREVRLVTYDAYALPEAAAAAFEERTGATITVVSSGDAGSMLAKAVLGAGAPEGDVIFGIDTTLASRVEGAGLLEDLDVPLDGVDPALLLPGELGAQLVPVDTGDVCVNLDREWFDAQGMEPPADLLSLAAPEYAPLLAVQDPLASSPGLAFFLHTVTAAGEDGFEDWWGQLRDNGVRVSPSWDDAYYNDYTVNGGDRPLVVSYATSPPAEVVFSEGTRTEPASEVLTGTCVAQVEYAGVLAGAAEPELAAELVEFMLSEQWQSELPLTNFVMPVLDVELPEEFRLWVPTDIDAVRLEPALVEGRDDLLEQWRSVME